LKKIQKKKQLYFSFLFTKIYKYLLWCAQTDQSQFSFPAGFRPEIDMLYPAPVSGTRKVWRTVQFLVPVNWYQKQAPETGQCVITITLGSNMKYDCQKCAAVPL